MSSRKYTWNAFETELDGAITGITQSIALVSATNLRAPGYLVIDPDDPTKREFISFTGISVDSLTGCTRGLAGGQSGIAHDSGAKVRAVMMHQFIDDTFTDIEALETSTAAHYGAGDTAHADVIAGGADGFMTGADKTKLDTIESNAKDDQTGGEILALLLGVDGPGSGIDADKLDGVEGAGYEPALTFGVAPNTIQAGDIPVEGIETQPSRADHGHGLSGGTPAVVQAGLTSAEGASSSVARADHQHGLSALAAVSVGAANAEGASGAVARSDHVHEITDGRLAVITADSDDTLITATPTHDPTWTTHASVAFTLPTNWGSALITATGAVHAAGADGNQQLNVRCVIGANVGTGNQGGSMAAGEETEVSAIHDAVVTGNETVKVEATITQDAISSLLIKYAWIKFTAIRAS